MVASNQLGYISMAEETGFYPEFVVTIDRTPACLPASADHDFLNERPTEHCR
jgi:hypothetical protein